MFFVQHIDGVIQVLVGAVVTWRAFRRPNKMGPRTTKFLKVCGPVLIVIGGLWLLMPSAAPSWQRQFTADKVASAEFPGPPKPEESIDTLGDVTVKRASSVYAVPGKDIGLFLSSSALPENARTATDAERIEGTLAYFTSQGSKVMQNEKDPAGVIYRLTLRQDEKKATVQMALAYVDGNVYRVVASWTDGSEDRALTDRFVSSFRVSTKQPNQ